MLTWMMQSISTSASTEMQQQHANEIMKQQILNFPRKMQKWNPHHTYQYNNGITEPPIEVLATISLMTDTKSISGVMEQCHDTTNSDDNDDIDVITHTGLLNFHHICKIVA